MLCCAVHTWPPQPCISNMQVVAAAAACASQTYRLCRCCNKSPGNVYSTVDAVQLLLKPEGGHLSPGHAMDWVL